MTEQGAREFDEQIRRSARRRVRILATTGIVIAIFLLVTGVTSHVLGSRTSTYRCEVHSVSESPLRDGTPSWHVATNCGGAIYINSEATTQTAAQAAELARSLRTGGTYELTVRGVLHNPLFISVDLLRAKPV